jgi:ribosome-binding factor A
MQSRRHQRVRELLKRELGGIILREFPGGDNGLVTVNDVEVAGDLRTAKVYVSILGTADQQKKTFGLLARYRARVQALLGHAVVLKRIPRLRFVIDESVVRGDRVLQIIEEIEQTLPSVAD